MSCNVYKPPASWWIVQGIKLLVIGVVVSGLFFDSIWALLPVCCFLCCFYSSERKSYEVRIRSIVASEFKDFITLLSGSINAGYSLEKALVRVLQDLEKEDKAFCYILPELRRIKNGVNLNMKVEDLLIDMGENLDLQEIKDFSHLIATAKVYGGNIMRLIDQTRKSLEDKVQVETELKTMISAKRLEGRIMTLVPFFIVGYMRFTNPGYMDFMYEGLLGRVTMSVALLIIVAMIIVIKKIVEIEV